MYDASSPAPPPHQVAVIVNPVKARAPQALAMIRARCADAGWPEPLVLETTVADPGAGQAREAIARGAEAVIAAGGDGTVREVAGALAKSAIPLGIVPLGTANIFARNIGLRPADLARNVGIALFGNEQRIDLGRAVLETPEAGDAPHEAAFLVVAGVGMDAAAIGQTSEVLKRRLGWVAYVWSLVRRLLEASITVQVAIDDGPAETRHLRTILVGNCGLIPAGIRLIPDAKFDDGVLDIAVIAPRTPLGWIPIAGKILLRHGRDVRALHYRTAIHIDVQPDHPQPVQLDGDVVDAVSRATFSIEPGALVVRTRPMTSRTINA